MNSLPIVADSGSSKFAFTSPTDVHPHDRDLLAMMSQRARDLPSRLWSQCSCSSPSIVRAGSKTSGHAGPVPQPQGSLREPY